MPLIAYVWKMLHWPCVLTSPALARGFFTTSASWEALREEDIEAGVLYTYDFNISVKWQLLLSQIFGYLNIP